MTMQVKTAKLKQKIFLKSRRVKKKSSINSKKPIKDSNLHLNKKKEPTFFNKVNRQKNRVLDFLQQQQKQLHQVKHKNHLLAFFYII